MPGRAMPRGGRNARPRSADRSVRICPEAIVPNRGCVVCYPGAASRPKMRPNRRILLENRSMSAALKLDFTIRPLGPVLAAEVIGLDLRHKLDAETRDAVHAAFIRHHVLCFRDQHLSPEEQIAFSEQFGTLERHMARNKGKANPLVHIVSNLGDDGSPSGKVASTGWHTDKSFRPEPSLATILHAVTMPPQGGETCFANMIAAYEALPETTRQALDGVGVVHSWALSRSNIDRKPTAEELADAPDVVHPLVRVIPETGKKA